MGFRVEDLLGGSGDVVSRVISKVTIVLSPQLRYSKTLSRTRFGV